MNLCRSALLAASLALLTQAGRSQHRGPSIDLALSSGVAVPVGAFANATDFNQVFGVVRTGVHGCGTFGLSFGGRWLTGISAYVNVYGYGHARLVQVVSEHYARPGTTIRVQPDDDDSSRPGGGGGWLYVGHRLRVGRWSADATAGVGAATFFPGYAPKLWRKTIGSNAIDTITLTNRREGTPQLFIQPVVSTRIGYEIADAVQLGVGVTYAYGRAKLFATERTSPLFGNPTEIDLDFRYPVTSLNIWLGVLVDFDPAMFEPKGKQK